MSPSTLRAGFIDGDRRLFSLLHTPKGGGGECTLVVPPFAEEMNKSRRLVAEFARQRCARGQAVLCVDLSGTGDSEGEFRDATVSRWVEDLATAIEWSAAQGWRVSSLLAVRFGALLAARLVRDRQFQPDRALFWQPVTNGARFMDQQLRIRVMASRLGRDGEETVAGLRERLARGEDLEVSGYEFSAALCRDVDDLDLVRDLPPSFPAIRWMEVGAVAGNARPRAVDKIVATGIEVDFQQVPGEPFWAATELVSVPALLEAS